MNGRKNVAIKAKNPPAKTTSSRLVPPTTNRFVVFVDEVRACTRCGHDCLKAKCAYPCACFLKETP